MTFTHVRPGKPNHQHDTVEQARLCEIGVEIRSGFLTRPNDVIRDPKAPGGWRKARHQDPCRCRGGYDMCWEFRVSTGTGHRALND